MLERTWRCQEGVGASLCGPFKGPSLSACNHTGLIQRVLVPPMLRCAVQHEEQGKPALPLQLHAAMKGPVKSLTQHLRADGKQET